MNKRHIICLLAAGLIGVALSFAPRAIAADSGSSVACSGCSGGEQCPVKGTESLGEEWRDRKVKSKKKLPDGKIEKTVEYTKYIQHPCYNKCGDKLDTTWWEKTDQKKQDKIVFDPKCSSGGDPVIFPTGNFVDGAEDLSVPIRSGSVDVFRRYSAQSDINGVLGRGWQSELHKKLQADGNGNVDVQYVRGSVLHFTNNGGTYTPQAGSFEALQKVDNDYTLTFKDKSKWYFAGATGVCTKAVDANANATLYHYDGSNVMTGMTDAASRQYTLTYDAGSRLTRFIDFGNRSVIYEYDSGNDLLTKVTLPWGPAGEPVYTAYNYYTAGAAQYKMHTRTYSGMPTADLVLYYDSDIRVTRQTLGAADYTWQYAANNVITQTDRDGNSQIWSYDDARMQTKEVVSTNRNVRAQEGDYTATWNYDSNYQPLTRALPGGSEERFLYDATGNPTKRTLVRGAISISEAVWFDADNNRISHQDGRGYTTHFIYDGARNVKTKTDPVVNLGQPSAQTIRETYDYNSYGLPTRKVDPNGVVTSMFYDGDGNLTKEVVDDGGLNLATVMAYDAFGNLTERTLPGGAKTAYYYDNGQLLTKDVEYLDAGDPSKQYAASYWYNPSGLLASKKTEHKDQSGTTMSPSEYLAVYHYAQEARVTKKTYQVDATNSITKSYIYNGEGAISREVLANGTEQSYVYDERNLLYQKVNCGGCGSTSVAFYLNETGQLTKQVDALGNGAVMAYDGFDRLTRTSYYDNQATPQLLSYEEQEYDANNNVTRSTVRDASNTVVARSTYCYDEINRLYETREWTAPGSAEGDNDARTVSLYDAASRLTKEKRLLNGPDASPTWAETSYHYDNAGRQTRVVDAEGGAVSYYYDKDGKLTKQTDAEGHDTTYAYDLLGRVTRQTNAAGHYAVMCYDSLGHALTTISYASGGTALAKAAQDYDALGRVTLSRKFADPVGAADDTKDYKTLTYYSANDRVTKTTDALGNSSTSYYDTSNRLQWQRDALGNKVEYVYDDNNNRITTISYEIDQVNGATKTFTVAALYDSRNRDTKTIQQGADADITQTSDNPITVVYYDALSRKTKVTDPENMSMAWLCDALGQVTRQTEDVGGFNRHTDYAYDRANRQTRITDNLSQSTDYAYDKLSHLTRTTYSDHDASADTVDQYYSVGGQMTKRVDQRNIATLYMYDSLSRLTKKQDDPSSSTIAEEYAHDALGRMTLAILTHSGTELSDVRYYYDGLGRSTRESQQIKAGTTRNVDMAYDKGGNRITLTYPGTKTVAYTYDAGNRVSRILDGANARARYLYVGPTRRSQVELLSGANTASTYKLTYDGMARITSALYRNSADDATITGFVHMYDKAGIPSCEIRTHQSNYGDAYMYDKLYRVTRVIYDDAAPTNPTYAVARAEDFVMDSIGNRTKIYAKSATATEYLHDPVNEYTKVGTDPYEYDAAGNLTKDKTYTYYWDYENRLTKVKKVSDSSDVAEYTYDAKMRRVEKIDKAADPDVTTRFYYGALPSEASAKTGWSDIEERDGDDAVTATYVNGPQIDEYVTMNRGENTYWYMQSPIVGNIAVLVNSSGAIQEGYTYTVYGTVTVHTGAGTDGNWFTSDDTTANASVLGSPFTFTGRRLDTDTMLMYFRNRMYQTGDGVFISTDPAQYVDGMSLYQAYFAPLGRDPEGLWNSDIHYDATMRWAKEVGCGDDCARRIAKADNDVDSYWPGETGPMPYTGDLSYHFDVNPDDWTATKETNAGVRGRHHSFHLARATGTCGESLLSLWQAIDNDLGKALHPMQDEWAHKEKGKSSKDGKGHLASVPLRHIGLLAGSEINRPNPHRPDDAAAFQNDVDATKKRTKSAIKQFLSKCPLCECQ